MIKPLLHRHHLDAFSTVLLKDLLDPKRHEIPDETRARLITYMTLAFYHYVQGQPITAASITETSHFQSRTVNRGLQYLAEVGLLDATQVANKQGRGRAFAYLFAYKLIKKVLAVHETLEPTTGAKRARA